MTLAPSLDLIASIERHNARAWPASIAIPIHGWEMRFAPNSSSKRVNSLNPVAPEAGQFRAVLKAYVAECRKRNSAAHVRLMPLAREDEREILSSLGVEAGGATSVEMMDDLSRAHMVEDSDVAVSSQVSDAWLDAYIGAHHYSDDERHAVRNILANIPHEMGFVHIRENGKPVASGRMALIDHVAGFYHIATAPEARRKGYARRIVKALIDYAARRGAKQGYLQVEMRNAPARALYGSLGFKPLYIYDYWPVPTSINL